MLNFAVIGNPIKHSISPFLHNFAIKSLGLEAFYGRYELEKSENLLNAILKLNLNGCNITLPFKEQAYQISDVLSDDAKNIGSVNTIIHKNGKIFGHNTDFSGFFLSLSKFKNINKALILGAGGTTRAIAYSLLKNGIKFDILNRSSKNFDFGASRFLLWSDEISPQYDLIINATSAGLNDNELPAPFELLSPLVAKSKFAFEVIYGKETPFLSLAKKHNLEISDGLEMLVNQAALAFELFFDTKFDLVKEIMQNSLKFKS